MVVIEVWRDWAGACVCVCGLRHEDHGRGGAGPYAAHAGRGSDETRRPAYEEDGNRVPSGVRSVQSVEASPLGAAVVCRDKNGDTLPFEAEKVLVAVE